MKNEAAGAEAASRQLERDIHLLEEQLEQTRDCDLRKERALQYRDNCVSERRAYQKSVVECETHSAHLEDAVLQRQACELELLSCRLPRRDKRVPEVAAELPETTITTWSEEQTPSPGTMPHIELVSCEGNLKNSHKTFCSQRHRQKIHCMTKARYGSAFLECHLLSFWLLVSYC